LNFALNIIGFTELPEEKRSI